MLHPSLACSLSLSDQPSRMHYYTVSTAVEGTMKAHLFNSIRITETPAFIHIRLPNVITSVAAAALWCQPSVAGTTIPLLRLVLHEIRLVA